MPSIGEVKESLVGKQLYAVPTPAVILDRATVERNCNELLKSCHCVGVKFRPHIKTHKTVEVTHFQLGQRTNDLNVVVSTLAEAEFIAEYLVKRKKEEGLSVNILYGLPIPPSQIERLAKLGQKLGPGSISVMVDCVGQIPRLARFHEITSWPIQVFVKVDTGYHRAGVKATPDDSSTFCGIVRSLFSKAFKDTVKLFGLYSHAGHSYSESSAPACMELLAEEIEGLIGAAKLVAKVVEELGQDRNDLDLTLSVGATPTVLTIVHHHGRENNFQDLFQVRINALKVELSKVLPKASLELHAGCYSFLDLQQVATKAGPSPTSKFLNTLSDIGITVLAEVNSLYNDRKPPEAMVAAGTLALGREPCQAYKGWGIVSDWGPGIETVKTHSGWIVGRVSQEHGMLELMSEVPRITEKVLLPMALSVGQKVRVVPNHACIAGAGFDYYVIVDSSLPEGRKNEVVDVWARCNGW